MNETETKIKKTETRHPTWRYASNATFQIPTTLLAATQGIYLYFYYFNVLGLNPGLIFLALSIFTVYDALNDPLIGFLVDRNTRLTKRWGRRFPWIAIGIIPWCLSIYLIFSAPGVDPAVNPWPVFLWLIMSLFVFDTFGSLIGVNVMALRPDLFRTEAERQKLTYWWTPLDMIAQAIGFLVPPLFLTGGGRADFAIMGAMIAVVALVGAILFLPGTREDQVVKERYFTGEYEQMNFFKGLWEVLKQRSFIIFFIALTVFSMATSMLMASAPFVNIFLLQSTPGDEFIIFVIFILGAFISVPLWIRYLRKIQNNKKVLTIGGFLLSATLFPLTFFQTTIDLYIMLFIIGLAMGSMWCFFYTIIQASVVDDFVATTKKNQKGILLGVSVLLGRLVATIDEGIFALVHGLTGFPAGEETYAGLVTAVTAAGGDLNLVLFGIRLLFGIIPCLILLVGTLVFWKFFPLTQDKILENKKILEELGF
jgi:GPH family glycoside/pentoside/hexuronide:cation symporter